MLKRLSSRPAALLAAALGLVLVVPAAAALSAPGAPSALPTDPTAVPLPRLDAADPAKAVVARVAFDSRTGARLEGTTVSLERAHTHLGDPPILRLTLRDVDAQVVEQLNAWSPLWVFTNGGQERLEIRPSGTGSFIVPFSPALSTMTIADVALARDVLTVDVKPAIRDFCRANPADPDCLEADLAVGALTSSAPLFAVLGKPSSVSVTTTFVNLGPDGPVDAVVSRSVTAGPGLTVTPTAAITGETSLSVGAATELTQSYTVTCVGAGQQYLDVTATVAAERATVIDPFPANNTRTERVLVDCAVPIAINIQPGSPRNPVSLSASTLPVAALTTRAGEYDTPLAFDARTIDAATLRFASASRLQQGLGAPELHTQIHPEDSVELDERRRDGDLDAVLHFRPRIENIAPSDTTACVTGRFTTPGATPLRFYGCDKVTVLP